MAVESFESVDIAVWKKREAGLLASALFLHDEFHRAGKRQLDNAGFLIKPTISRGALLFVGAQLGQHGSL
jgi:hypothetical protein